jgi:hypothetical protein
MKAEREPLHPAYINRRLMECLPSDVEEFVCGTILGLFSFSGQWMTKAELEAGRIEFAGSVSYSQLAAFCKIDYETAKWRVKQLRDRWGLVSWKKLKLGIGFTVAYETVNQLTDCDESETGNGLPESKSPKGHDRVTRGLRQGHESSSQVTEQSSQVISGVESGNGLPPLSLNCLKPTVNPSDGWVGSSKEKPTPPALPVSEDEDLPITEDLPVLVYEDSYGDDL